MVIIRNSNIVPLSHHSSRKIEEAGNALICRKGIVGVTSVPSSGITTYAPNGFEWIASNVGGRSAILVKQSEIPQFTYKCRDGSLALDLEKVTFNASAMRLLGVRFN